MANLFKGRRLSKSGQHAGENSEKTGASAVRGCHRPEGSPGHFTYRQIFSHSKDHFGLMPETRHDLLRARIPYRLLSGVT
jgi:hypothetical protein